MADNVRKPPRKDLIEAIPHRNRRYPVRYLKVKEGFFVPESRGDLDTIICTCRRQAKTANMKIITRKVEGGVRIWRIG